MTYATRAVDTRVLVCDLCGDPIDENAESGARGNILWGVSPINQVTEKTRHAGIWWPTFRTGHKPAFTEDAPMKTYDFHGVCIARLVHEAVTEREAQR